jgi:quaternary ammonium compound-resistance protein SugE
MAWLYVIVAGLLEVGMALSLKESHGFSRWPWVISFVAFGVSSFALLSLGLRTLPVGSAYAVWTGIGACGTALAGILILGDSHNAIRLTAIALIIAGVAILQVSGNGH